MLKTKRDYSLDVVIPCYHEEEALPQTIPTLIAYFTALEEKGSVNLGQYRIILVDDGSKDNTWHEINALSEAYPQICGVKLARNYGHQAAMLAGLEFSTAEAILTMDADLQDDIHAVEKMLTSYERGAELALGVRDDRQSDSFFKRTFANGYYKILSMLGAPIIENHADFRLTSRRALNALLAHREVNLFLRGIIPSIGMSPEIIHYSRKARELGTSKYTITKMLRLAIDGITSFSVAPLRLISVVGAITFFISFVVGFVFLLQRIFSPETVVPGWTSTVLPLLLLGGFQILTIGVLGEYVGKIYMEVKQRPRFIIQDATDQKHEN